MGRLTGRLTRFRAAFTLIEMVVVLAIIALVTHLAVRSLASLDDTRRHTAASHLLDDIRLAVYDDTRGDGVPRGFLADMGRLPRLAPLYPDMTQPTNSTLSELWRRPDGVRDFEIRAALKENIVPALDSLVASNVYIGTGWRGPYLQLGAGRTRLLDPWGNAMELEDSAGLKRLFVTNGYIVAAAHYGARAQRGAAGAAGSMSGATVSLLPPGMAAPEAGGHGGAQLIVGIFGVDSAGAEVVPQKESEWRLYSPSGDGRIAVQVVSNVTARAVFRDVAPGCHALWNNCTTNAQPQHVIVPPGGCTIDVKLKMD